MYFLPSLCLQEEKLYLSSMVVVLFFPTGISGWDRPFIILTVAHVLEHVKW